MHHVSLTVTIDTKPESFTGIAGVLTRALTDMNAANGILHIFLAHTSASLCVQENADPDVLADLRDALRALAPEARSYRHGSEGPDDMPAHIKAMLTSASISVPVRQSRLALGMWQEIYLIEHRATPHCRRIELDFIGALRQAG